MSAEELQWNKDHHIKDIDTLQFKDKGLHKDFAAQFFNLASSPKDQEQNLQWTIT